MRCPRCADDSLRERTVPDLAIHLDVCGDCDGVWYDGGELEQLMTLAKEELHVLDVAAPSERLCPRCLREMFVFNFPQTLVTVDMCGHCRGLWLDANEAEQIKSVRTKYERLKRSGDAELPTGIAGDLLRLLDRITDWL
ncbi:MAG: zf-TFIIB domain-containing protein [Planctomycetaceae bacterium]